jgi:transposase
MYSVTAIEMSAISANNGKIAERWHSIILDPNRIGDKPRILAGDIGRHHRQRVKKPRSDLTEVNDPRGI